MAQQVTKRDLEGVVKRINLAAGMPLTPYTKSGGKYIANIGNYHLDWAYGGVKLSRMSSAGGGTSDPLYSGYTTKRELYNMLHAFVNGMEAQEMDERNAKYK